jgi:hypothetical protein
VPACMLLLLLLLLLLMRFGWRFPVSEIGG